MNQTVLINQLSLLLNEVLGTSGIILQESTTTKDIDGWDSLTHALFISEIQQHFKVKFALREVLRLKNVGAICALVSNKIASH